MEILQYFLQYFQELCEGRFPVPEGLTVTGADADARAEELQGQIAALGIPEFVRLCAAARGDVIDPAAFERYDPAALGALGGALAQGAQAEQPETENAPEEPEEPVKSEIRDIYEVFLDSVCLDDRLVEYLIDVVKRHDTEEFKKLSHAAARTLLDMDEFLLWLGNKQWLAPPEEQDCVQIMDACLERLAGEGQRELLAALLSGDEQTFCRFRCDAPELRQLPQATFEWYSTYYLDRYYPVRFLMKCNGVKFPEA